MQPINGISGPLTQTSGIEAFRQGAAKAEEIQAMVVDGHTFKVMAVGQMPTGSQRSVAWVQGDVDTTALFMQAFSASFGGRLSAAVSQELGLAPAPGKPLASRAVTQALDMAQTGQQAFAGVDFLTQLAHSASAGGAAFKSLVTAQGIPPGVLSKAICSQIDSNMRQRFEAAASAGESPVSATVAANWLRAELTPFAASTGATVSLGPAGDEASPAFNPQQRP